MCALGDVAELVAKFAPHGFEQISEEEVAAKFANREHALDFIQTISVLVSLYYGERE